MSIYFAGKKRTIPGAYSDITVESQTPRGAAYPRAVAILGPSLGGEPGKALRFSDPVRARETLRGGNLLKACELAWNPSPDFSGADEIVAIRTDAATASALALKDAAVADVIDVTSRDWGAWTKNIRMKIENGASNATYVGVKKITIENQLKPGDYEIGDDLGKGFKMKFTEATVCAVTITVANGNATRLQTSAAGADALDLDLTLPAFNTLSKLVAHIDSLVKYEAVLDGPDAPSSDLDVAAAVSIQQVFGYFTRTLHGCINWLNNSQYVQAAAEAAVTVNAPANLMWTNLATGTDGSEDATSWNAAVALLLGLPDVAYVVACCGDGSFYDSANAMTVAGVKNAFDTAGLRQRAFLGADLATTAVADVKAKVSQARSYRSSFYAPGIKRLDENGALETLGAWASAAMAAGLTVALDKRNTLTNKYLSMPALEADYTRAEIIDLIETGVVPLQMVPGRGCKFVQGVTTDITSTEAFFAEQSNVDIADYIVGTLETALEQKFIGKLANLDLLTGVKAAVHSFLQQATDDGLLAGDDSNPAFRAIGVTLVESVVTVSYEASVSKPGNFILQKAHFTPVRLSA